MAAKHFSSASARNLLDRKSHNYLLIIALHQRCPRGRLLRHDVLTKPHHNPGDQTTAAFPLFDLGQSSRNLLLSQAIRDTVILWGLLYSICENKSQCDVDMLYFISTGQCICAKLGGSRLGLIVPLLFRTSAASCFTLTNFI